MADLPVSVFVCLHLVIVHIITNMTSNNLIFCSFNVLDFGSDVFDGLALLIMCLKTVEMSANFDFQLFPYLLYEKHDCEYFYIECKSVLLHEFYLYIL